jgi:hypothetical protein
MAFKAYFNKQHPVAFATEKKLLKAIHIGKQGQTVTRFLPTSKPGFRSKTHTRYTDLFGKNFQGTRLS